MSFQADFGAPAFEASAGRPTWERLSECPRCITYRPNLVRTAATAVVVGTVLFAINHLAAVVAGHASTSVWVATAVSYVVPFCVSNIGLLVASRRKAAGARLATDRLWADPGRSRVTPTWQRLTECPRCIVYPPHLTRTVATALVVGTAYFAINQLGTVLRGHASTGVWVASGVTYLVPFCVSNIGLLVGCRRTT